MEIKNIIKNAIKIGFSYIKSHIVIKANELYLYLMKKVNALEVWFKHGVSTFYKEDVGKVFTFVRKYMGLGKVWILEKLLNGCDALQMWILETLELNIVDEDDVDERTGM